LSKQFKTLIMAGRKKIPIEEKRIRIEPFIQKKAVDLIGKKECEKIAVDAIEKEFKKQSK
jgi:hypothetical protein